MIRRQRMPWTEQEDEALRGLSRTLSLPRLAIRLGRTQYAVKRRASDLRIKLLTKQDFKRRLNAAPAPALVAEEPRRQSNFALHGPAVSALVGP
jgi:hypothetical protein